VSEFLAMGGYAFYVWGSYGVTALVLIIETLGLRSRRRATLEEARLSAADEPATAIKSGGAQ
jgi:heme exporter protein D